MKKRDKTICPLYYPGKWTFLLHLKNLACLWNQCCDILWYHNKQQSIHHQMKSTTCKSSILSQKIDKLVRRRPPALLWTNSIISGFSSINQNICLYVHVNKMYCPNNGKPKSNGQNKHAKPHGKIRISHRLHVHLDAKPTWDSLSISSPPPPE